MNTTSSTAPAATNFSDVPAPRSRKYTSWRLCAGAGPVFLVGYIISWGLLGYNVPPIDPGISQTDLYTHYVDNSVRLRAAMTMSLFFAPFYFVFSALLSRVVEKIEGQGGPLALIEQVGGSLTTVVLLVGGVSWLTAAFRVDERTPEIVRQLHDFGWMFFDATFMCTSLQMLAVALAILLDKRDQPLLPRWMAWFSVLAAMMFMPIVFMPFFLGGPFAWNGLVNYWMGFSTFFWWVLFLCFLIPRAIGRLEREAAAA